MGKHIHLDLVGGIAGDMFIAANLDAHPELKDSLLADISALELNQTIEILKDKDHSIRGTRFIVKSNSPIKYNFHRTQKEIHKLLMQSNLKPEVIDRAIKIFDLLIQAESKIHGIPIENVALHEAGADDSIIDVVGAAHIIDKLQVSSCSSSVLPIGSGTINCKHGVLPIPTPATVFLIEGFPTQFDGEKGERITPTGAAILRYLSPKFELNTEPMKIYRSGFGFGKNRFQSTVNALRIIYFNTEMLQPSDNVGIIEFSIDDQTPEELAASIEHIRNLQGVFDVIQFPGFGKKGRLLTKIEIITHPMSLNDVIQECFVQTTTIGLRYRVSNRIKLERYSDNQHVEGKNIKLKCAERPNGSKTFKAEHDDLVKYGGNYSERSHLKKQVENKKKI